MAFAVMKLSQVIIIILIHAVLHFSIASLTSSLGGSIIACNHTNIRSSSLFLFQYANHKTLNASSENFHDSFNISSLPISSKCFTSQFNNILLHLGRMFSIAHFV
jgi:hypothetical protein